MVWQGVVRVIGGYHGFGWSRLHICIHDTGVFVAWDQVIKWEWRKL